MVPSSLYKVCCSWTGEFRQTELQWLEPSNTSSCSQDTQISLQSLPPSLPALSCRLLCAESVHVFPAPAQHVSGLPLLIARSCRFWHSMWHILMGFAYYEVYSALCSSPKHEAKLKGYTRVLSTSRSWWESIPSTGEECMRLP